MDPERKAKLDEIGFDFNPKGNAKENWNLQFKKLRDYYEKHGHCKFFGLSTIVTSSSIPPLTLHLHLSLNCSQYAIKERGRPITGHLDLHAA
jgi:hypothetical protein